MEGIERDELLSRLNHVKVLLNRLVSSRLVDSFWTTRLDVSLLKKLKTTLVKHQAILEQQIYYQRAVGHLSNLLQYNLFDINYLFDEIHTEAFQCKGKATLTPPSQVLKNPYSSFRQLIHYKLQRSIERLEFLSSTTSSDLVDDSSMQLLSLSTSIKMLSDRIDSTELVLNFRRRKLDVSLLENLKIELRYLNIYAEKRQITNIFGGHWRDMARNVVFEVGYFFDEINTEALQSIREAKYQTQTTTSQVSKNLSSPLKRFNGATNSKFQKLIERLEFMSSRAEDGCYFKRDWNETPTFAILEDESSIYGRDGEIEKLKHLLLSGDSKMGIISIVGIAGIGKTTLAKLLYNDPEVCDKFELKVWAHVSEYFDETILDDLNTNRNDTSDVNNIYPKFLLVLDEVRDARPIDWTLFRNISSVGVTGSRIIITTRDERIAPSMQTFEPSMQTFLFVHYLRPLESEDCWSLLARHAFGACNDQPQFNLQNLHSAI